MNILPPSTQKNTSKEVLHEIEITDPYRWLEDVKNEKVQAWISKQDKYTRRILDALPEREYLSEKFEKIFREETLGFPYPRKNCYFFTKRKSNEEHSVLYIQKGLNGKPKVLVNPNEISKNKGLPISLRGYSVSKDAKFITYSLSETSNDQNDLFVMNIDTGETLDKIPANLYPSNGSWSLDNRGFWYTRRKEDVPKGEEKFHRKVFYHTLGTNFSNDLLVYGEELAKEDSPGASATLDGRYLVIHVRISSEKNRRSEIYIQNLEKNEIGFRPIVKNILDEVDTYFYGSVHRDFFYIVTNYKTPKAKIQRVALCDIDKGLDAWQTVIAESVDKIINSISLINNSLFVLTLENVYSALREYTLDGIFKRQINFPVLGTSYNVVGEPEGNEAFFGFDSFVHPYTIFRIDLNTNKVAIFKQQKIDFDIKDFTAEQVWYQSKDGTNIPMFLVHKKNLSQNKHNPVLLNGYGGFNISLRPSFTKSVLPFLERGGIYAVANIRGGGEFGEEWHKAGTKKKKQNVFDDFIAAAEWLIKNEYTSSEYLAISGGSNGGLLVGAVMTQRPKLVKAVIMSVPLTDMLRYHLFHGGRHWIPDYGSVEDKNMFSYLLKYSPYHNVKDGVEYPATMVITSDNDDRVHPGQAFKMVARLQKIKSNNPIILRVERNAGHSGASDISRYINKAVDEWSFIFDQLGIKYKSLV